MSDPTSPDPAGGSPTPDSGASGASRTPLDALAERLSFPPGLGARASHGVLLLALSVGASVPIPPGAYITETPEAGPDDIGKPCRASSPSGFKGRRDYEIIDGSMTDQRRKEASASVLTVFDYDPLVQSGVTRAVQLA